MKTNTLLFLLVTILSLPADLVGGTDEPGTSWRALSLREVTRLVSERNPAIREALRRWEAAKQRVVQEGAWDDLRVSGTSKVRRYVDVPPNAFTDQIVSVEQAIPISGKKRGRAQISAAHAIT